MGITFVCKQAHVQVSIKTKMNGLTIIFCFSLTLIIVQSGETKRGYETLGDRCPDHFRLPSGGFPDFCYDVMNEHGDCLLDDMELTKEQCISWHGEEFYERMKAIQEERNARRKTAQ